MICVENTMVRDHHGTHRNHKTGEALPPFRVNLAIHNPYATPYINLVMQRPLSKADVRAEVEEWCRNNCMGTFHIGKAKTIHFEREEDALLFWFTFRGNPHG